MVIGAIGENKNYSNTHGNFELKIYPNAQLGCTGIDFILLLKGIKFVLSN